MSSRAVVVLSLAAFASAAALRAADPLLPLLAESFGTTAGGASAVITAFAVAYGALQVVNGPLSDRLGKYRMVFWVTAISAAGNLACALAPSLPVLVLTRFATGATVGAIVPLAIAWIGDTVPYERRQPVLARFLIGNMLGIGLATTVSGWLGELYGWRAIFYALAGLYVVTAALLWFELRTNPATRQVAKASESIAQAFVRMLGLTRLPWVRVILLTVFTEGMLFSGPLAFAAYHVHRNLGLGIASSGALVAAFAGGGLVYAAVAGRLVPRMGERGLVLGGALFIGAGYAGLAAASAPGYVVPCLLALGAGFYMLHNTLQVHATQMAPESRGAALTLFAFCLFGGQSAGVWLAARVVDAFGTRPVFAIAAVGLPLLALNFRRLLAARLRALRLPATMSGAKDAGKSGVGWKGGVR
jgi:MFS transporter, YNFM family, putative membrane transport protein